MTTVILIRHGESVANRQKVFAGHLDVDLQDKGLEQAKVTARYVADNYKIDKIYASDLLRAYKTATCLGEILHMDVIKDEKLREISAGEWEGKKFDELVVDYANDYGVWINHIGYATCTGGESVEQLGNRIMDELTKIAEENDGKTVAIGTHATPIRVAQTIIQTGSVKEMENIPWTSNASVTVLEYDDGKWSVKAVGLDEHLAEFKTVFPANV